MNETSSGPNLLNDLAHEFADRYRRGERPALTEYTEKYPELAAEIRELFPALAMMEQFASRVSNQTGPYAQSATADGTVPRQLGEYRILREVARGGMGIVYEAVQESLGRHVALKVLPFQSLARGHDLERFQREARAAANLHHTNIVPVFGVGVHEGIHYYAMQFIQGQSLDSVLGELRRLRRSQGNAQVPVEEAGSAAQEDRRADLSVSLAGGLLSGRLGSHSPLAAKGLGAPSPLGGEDPRGTDWQSVLQPSLPHMAKDPEAPSPLVGEGRGGGRKSAAGTSSSELAVGALSTILDSRAEVPSQTETEYFRSIARVGVQVAEALAYAHGQGVLHRDIKPSNLLLDTQGTVWVTDFGLAKAADSDDLTHTGDIVGTLRYMAPERFQGRADARSDVYGLGVTLYELVTFQPAFQDLDRARLIQRVVQEEPARPRKLNRAVPRDLETVVLKAMAKEPERRYSTASALAEDLRRLLADRPIRARRSAVPERLWLWCRRNPAVAILLGLVALVLLAGTVVSSYFAVQATERAKEADANAKTAEHNAEIATGNAKEAETQKTIAQENEESAKASAALAQQRFYAAQMNLAMQAWEAGHPARVLELLESQRPKFDQDDLRGFEWYYLWRLCQSGKRFTLRGHKHSIACVAFSPDGQTLASASWDSNVKLWDVATGQDRCTLRGHSNSVESVAFSPDGKILASGGFDATVKLWDIATGHERASLPQQKWVRALAFSPDGKTLATGEEFGNVRLWDLAKRHRRAILRGHSGPVLSVAFSPDGKALATGSGWGKLLEEPGIVTLWDLTAEPVCSRLQLPTNAYHVAFGPDGKTLAVGNKEGRVELWNVITGKLRASQQGHRGWVHWMAFAPDGNTVASTSKDRTVKLWDVATWQERASLAHRSPVLTVAFAPDGKTLASGTSDATIELWDMGTKAESATLLQHTGAVHGVVFSRDGKTLVSAGRHPTMLWDVATGRTRATLSMSSGPSTSSLAGSTPANPSSPATPAGASRNSSHGRSLAVSPDGTTLASSAGNETAIRLWNLATGQEKATLKGHTKPVICLAFAPNGRTLASGAEDATVKLWDLGTQQARATITGHWGSVTGVAFSPDGKTLASVRHNESVDVWDAATGQARATFQGDQGGWHWGSSVAFSHDGKTLAAGNDRGTVKLWDAITGQLRTSMKGHTDRVNSVAFFPDDKSLATGSEDMTVKLWDVATGQERVTLKGHKSAVAAIAIAPDGKTLASGGADSTVRLWRAATDAEASARKTEFDSDDPESPVVLNNWADRLLATGRLRDAAVAYRQATSRLEKLVAELPTFPEYRQELARRYVDLGNLSRKLDRPEEAERAYRQGIKIGEDLLTKFPKDPSYQQQLFDTCARLGTLLTTTGRRREANEVHAKVLERIPDDAGAQNGLAWSLVTSPDPDVRDAVLAVALAKRAVERAPGAGYIWNTLGVAHYRAGNWKDAVAALDESMELQGHVADWFFLAMAHWQLGDKAQARKWYTPAILWMDKHQSTDVELCTFRAEAAGLLGLPEHLPQTEKQAKLDDVEIYNLVLQANPGSAGAYGGRGGAYAAAGQWDKAAADLERAVQLKPEGVMLHYWLGLARIGAGDLDGYRSACAAVLRRFGQTDKPDVAHWAAWTAVLAPDGVKEWDRLVQLAETPLRRDPKNENHSVTLGGTLYRAGRFGEAIHRLQEANTAWENAATKPTMYSPAYMWFFLAMAHQRLAHAEAARQWLEKGIKWMDREVENPGNEASRSWNRRLTLQLLRREAEAVLKEPAAAKANEKPT
jgi:WD40 repeat protein/serine/threonine protein kinase/tetratricopeptide (TPR) repeat protein